jgi:hypothetical protein
MNDKPGLFDDLSQLLDLCLFVACLWIVLGIAGYALYLLVAAV